MRLSTESLKESSVQVEIWSDIVCPWCYIGKKRFERALGAFTHRDEIDIAYRSFELDPTIPVGEERDVVEDLALKKGLSTAQVHQLMKQVETLAAGEGLEYHLAEAKSGNTVDAHQLVHLGTEKGIAGAVIERLYQAHFTELRSVFDHDSLVSLAEEAGLDGADAKHVLDDGTYKEAVSEDESLARSFGITGVPFFVIDRKYGISGAQNEETFLEALERAWAEKHPLTIMGADGQICEDGVCY
jgi:predicted DsbA family dithiol-disulfide isomerase